MKQFKGTGIYLIKEQIYIKTGLPTLANTIGPTAIQVVKSVYQLMNEQDLIYKGSLLNSHSNVGVWDRFKIVFGIDVSEKDKLNGDSVFMIEYCGFSTFITPIDGFDRILPRWFTSKHNASVPTPYTFGRDPISDVNLYRNLNAKFFVNNGGDGVPESLAKYNSKTKELKIINSEPEFLLIIKSLTKIKGGK